MAQLEHLKLFCGNVGGDPSPPLGKVITDHTPHVLVVVEAKNARGYLHDLAEKHDYRHKQPTTENYGAEAPDIAVLITKAIDLGNHDVMKMDEPWWYNGKKRKPRRYQRFHLPGWHLEALHFPPGGPSGGGSKTGGKNKPAWMESCERTKKRLRDWHEDDPKAALLAVGDFNGTHDEVHHHIAEPLDAYMTKYGKVNHAVRKRAKELSVKHLDANDGHGGHGWAVAKFEHA